MIILRSITIGLLSGGFAKEGCFVRDSKELCQRGGGVDGSDRSKTWLSNEQENAYTLLLIDSVLKSP